MSFWSLFCSKFKIIQNHYSPLVIGRKDPIIVTTNFSICDPGLHLHHEEVRPGEDRGEEALVCDRLLPTRLHRQDVQVRGAALAGQLLPHVLQ